jgi:hypothetical protein
MTGDDVLARLRPDYASAFLGYLTQRQETGLRAAYELGRAAMSQRVSILDLVQVHHDVVVDILRTVKTSTELQDVGRAAAQFLVEVLASFDMTQRGFMEKAEDSRQGHPSRSVSGQ